MTPNAANSFLLYFQPTCWYVSQHGMLLGSLMYLSKHSMQDMQCLFRACASATRLQGCLAMKMLGWEDPFSTAINAIRAKEVSYAARMAQIKGLNLALQ